MVGPRKILQVTIVGINPVAVGIKLGYLLPGGAEVGDRGR